jgi:LacI family transcriptional regulator
MGTVASKSRQGQRSALDVETHIRSAIERGELQPGAYIGSAQKLARQLNSSYGAVRQALEILAVKGLLVRKPRAGTFVSSTVAAVRPDPGRRNIIGLMIPDIRLPDCALIARHLQDALMAASLEVLISSTDNERERYDQSVLRQLQAGVGGLVLVSPQQARISLSTLMEIEKSQIPVVNYARPIEAVSWPTVQTDVFQCVYLPVKHLCDLGRKRIAYLSYPVPARIGTEMNFALFRAAFDSGLAAANIFQQVIPADLYLGGWSDNRTLRQILKEWLDQHPGIDAICCTHDHIAAAMLNVLAEQGVRVPEDVAVTGSLDSAESFGLASGELTTVNTCIDVAMMHVVRLLLEGRRVDDGQDAPIIAVKPRLVLGRSTIGALTQSS